MLVADHKTEIRGMGPGDDWLGDLIRAKPLKVVAIALANRMARAVWAMLRTGESWRAA